MRMPYGSLPGTILMEFRHLHGFPIEMGSTVQDGHRLAKMMELSYSLPGSLTTLDRPSQHIGAARRWTLDGQTGTRHWNVFGLSAVGPFPAILLSGIYSTRKKATSLFQNR